MRTIAIRCLAVAAVVAFAPLLVGQKIADPMDMALSLAKGPYAGFVYKQKGNRKSIDCTEFVGAVAKQFAKVKKQKLDKQHLRTLAVATIKKGEDLQKLVDAEDRRIKGVQQALVDAGHGKAVEIEDARRGDLIQYWYRTSKGWRGHAGIVEKVEKNGKRYTLTVFGSHKSTLRKRVDGTKASKAGGVGSGPRLVVPDAKKYKVFLVRWQ